MGFEPMSFDESKNFLSHRWIFFSKFQLSHFCSYKGNKCKLTLNVHTVNNLDSFICKLMAFPVTIILKYHRMYQFFDLIFVSLLLAVAA